MAQSAYDDTWSVLFQLHVYADYGNVRKGVIRRKRSAEGLHLLRGVCISFLSEYFHIFISIPEKQINIVNYNKPLPPIRISDLNERTFFNERDTENPELRDMFKALGIIESFGTGIGEAKRSMIENGSPDLYYKTFDINDNVTSVVIPVNEEYAAIKITSNPKKKVWIENETKDFKQKIMDSKCSKNIKQNILKLYEEIGMNVFGNSRVVEIFGCSEVTATSYLKRMENELEIIVPVEGLGKGKYRFSL